MKPILSPIQLLQNEVNQKQRNELLTKIAQDLLEIHSKFIAKLDEVNNVIDKKVGPKGDKGDTPSNQEILSLILPFLQDKLSDQNLIYLLQPFISDLKGKYIPTKEELLAIINPLISEIENGETPIKGVDYPDEKQIQEYIKTILKEELSDLEKKTNDTIETAISKKKFTSKHIDGLEQTISARFNQLKAQGGYLHGGGVPSLTAGSNITLTQKSDGGYIVTSTGGSGSGFQQPTGGTVDGLNTVFVFAQAPNVIVVDGIPKQKLQSDGVTTNWTGTTTITLTIAPNYDIFASA